MVAGLHLTMWESAWPQKEKRDPESSGGQCTRSAAWPGHQEEGRAVKWLTLKKGNLKKGSNLNELIFDHIISEKILTLKAKEGKEVNTSVYYCSDFELMRIKARDCILETHVNGI